MSKSLLQKHPEELGFQTELAEFVAHELQLSKKKVRDRISSAIRGKSNLPRRYEALVMKALGLTEKEQLRVVLPGIALHSDAKQNGARTGYSHFQKKPGDRGFSSGVARYVSLQLGVKPGNARKHIADAFEGDGVLSELYLPHVMRVLNVASVEEFRAQYPNVTLFNDTCIPNNRSVRTRVAPVVSGKTPSDRGFFSDLAHFVSEQSGRRVGSVRAVISQVIHGKKSMPRSLEAHVLAGIGLQSRAELVTMFPKVRFPQGEALIPEEVHSTTSVVENGEDDATFVNKFDKVDSEIQRKDAMVSLLDGCRFPVEIVAIDDEEQLLTVDEISTLLVIMRDVRMMYGFKFDVKVSLD